MISFAFEIIVIVDEIRDFSKMVFMLDLKQSLYNFIVNSQNNLTKYNLYNLRFLIFLYKKY